MSQRIVQTPGKLLWSISGTGNQVKVYDFFGDIGTSPSGARSGMSGRVLYFFIRNNVGSGATSGVFYLLDQNFKPAAGSTPSAYPEDNMVVKTAATPLTASATAASLSTSVDATPCFSNSLYLVGDITAVGDWTVTGYVTVLR